MGGVGLNIYGIKDQWSSFVLHLVVLPNNQLASTIGHVYLDCTEKHGGNYKLLIGQVWLILLIRCQLKGISITFVIDRGLETGYIYAFQTGLR